MPKITLTGVSPAFDGDYDLNFDDAFNGNELHLIKKVSGIRVGEISEAMEAGDYDLIVCLTKIAIDRSGQAIPVELLMAAKVGAITFGETAEEIADRQEEEKLPPTNAPIGVSTTKSAAPTSGTSSKNGSDSPPENDRSATGTSPSDTGATWAQVRSAS